MVFANGNKLVISPRVSCSWNAAFDYFMLLCELLATFSMFLFLLGLAKKSPRKRRSDELGLTEPPLKRKRVSFGGHLSPELFDKRLPPNSPLKKGATPARRSLSLNSPRTVIRKSFGLKQTVIRVSTARYY